MTIILKCVCCVNSFKIQKFGVIFLKKLHVKLIITLKLMIFFFYALIHQIIMKLYYSLHKY